MKEWKVTLNGIAYLARGGSAHVAVYRVMKGTKLIQGNVQFQLIGKLDKSMCSCGANVISKDMTEHLKSHIHEWRMRNRKLDENMTHACEWCDTCKMYHFKVTGCPKAKHEDD